MECWEQAAIAERELLDGAKPDLWNYNKALEALCFHSSFWPIVMELTNGKPSKVTLLRLEHLIVHFPCVLFVFQGSFVGQAGSSSTTTQ